MTRYTLNLTTPSGNEKYSAFFEGFLVHTTYFGGEDTSKSVPVETLSVGDKICTPSVPDFAFEISGITTKEI
jgi:hypothetical protein